MPNEDWGEVERTRPFWASKVGLARICPLRLLLEQEPAYDPEIPSSPLAVLGSILHEVVAELVPGNDVEEAVETAISAKLIPSDATRATAVPLYETVSPSELAARVGVAKRLATNLTVRTKSGARRRPRPLPLRNSDPFARSNVWLNSTEHDLCGSLDHLERTQEGLLTVSEAKTGRIRDTEGQLKGEHFAQLLSYGLLVQANMHAESIVLRLCGIDGTEVVRFDDVFAENARSALQHLQTLLPRNVQLKSSELATCGTGCYRCSYRNRCADYRAWAPRRWTDPESGHLPLDCWGIMEKVEADSEPWLARIYVRDPTGHLASITHVPRRLLPLNVQTGCLIAAFNLRSFERRSSKRPANFAVASLRRTYESAHDAVLFFEKNNSV